MTKVKRKKLYRCPFCWIVMAWDEKPKVEILCPVCKHRIVKYTKNEEIT